MNNNNSNIVDKRNWRTGYFIQSAKTAHWPQRQIDLTNEDENRMVFANFTEGDKGRSRKRICTCENKEDAELICKAVNNYDEMKSLLSDSLHIIKQSEKYKDCVTTERIEKLFKILENE